MLFRSVSQSRYEGPYINEAKKQINNIIDHIKESNQNSIINIAFVCYRDFSNYDLRLKSIDFTTDAEQVKHFIANEQAISNNDEAEDVAGGLNLGLSLSWSSKAKYTILIADAPCHGKKYHNGIVYDNHKDGCPKGLVIEDLVKEYARREIVLSVMKITNDTDLMFKIMSDAYKEISNNSIQINDLKTNQNDFGIIISHGAATTLNSITFDGVSIKDFLNNIQKDTLTLDEATNQEKEKINLFITRMNNLIEENEKSSKAKELQMDVDDESKQTDLSENSTFEETNNKEINLKFDIDASQAVKAPINWNDISQFIFNSKCHSFNIPKDRNSYINWKNPFIKHSFINSEVKIADTPFSEGAMRYAFYMKDLSLDQNLVGKINKTTKVEDYTLDNLSKDLLSQVVCKRIAFDFNERIINLVSNTNMLLTFVDTFIYEMINYSSNTDLTVKQMSHHHKYFSAENYIDGNYVKFNNNSGWIANNLSEQSQIAQAFSHFSWQYTKGYLS